ncbi:MAG: trypsin-like peptidase domain-containing protein [Verrucomicrobiota bacterium]
MKLIVPLLLSFLVWGPAANGESRGAIEAWKNRQLQIRTIVKTASPAVVAVEGITVRAMGSGIVIDGEGHVLTAAHVILTAGDYIRVRFPDGTSARATALGANLSSDAGLLKIEGDGPWPHVKMGVSKKTADGDWVVSLGHPGGFDRSRRPPVRLGRVWSRSKGMLATDCALASGDSGGPLFDLGGNVIGIHSSIGENLAENRHIAVEVFRDQWDRLVAGDRWGSLSMLTSSIDRPDRPMLGVILEPEKGGPPGAVLREVVEGAPAERAGLKAGDRIVAIGQKEIGNNLELMNHVARLRAGTSVNVRFFRSGRERSLVVNVLEAEEISFPDPQE